MMIDKAFKFLKIISDRKSRSQKSSTSKNCVREETISVKLRFIYNNYNSKVIRPSCQSSSESLGTKEEASSEQWL